MKKDQAHLDGGHRLQGIPPRLKIEALLHQEALRLSGRLAPLVLVLRDDLRAGPYAKLRHAHQASNTDRQGA